MTFQSLFCGQCGSRLPGEVSFCGHCGAEITPWSEDDSATPKVYQLSPSRQQNTSKRGRSLRVAALLATMSLATWSGLQWWSQAGTTRAGMRTLSMPALSLEHPTGVSLQARAGTFPESTKLEISVQDNGPSTGPFQRKGRYVQIDGLALQEGQKATQVVVPVEKSTSNPVLLVESLGRWIRVPTTTTQLPDGRTGLQVNIDGFPLPWKMVVCEGLSDKPPEVLASGENFSSSLARLEQLRITDKSAFLAEIDQVVAPKDSSASSIRSFLFTPAYAQKSKTSSTVTFESVNEELQLARHAFLRADGLIKGLDKGREADRRSSAVKLYRDGLEHLWQARQGLAKLSPTERTKSIEDWDDSLDDAVYGDDWKLEQLVEYYCGTFAPWGLQLTKGILADYQIHRRGFDVRVLPFFGQLAYVDVTLPGGEKPLPLLVPGERPTEVYKALDLTQRQMAERLKLIPEQAKTFQVVRFYSPRLYNWNTSEWLLAAKSGNSVVASGLALAVLAEGAPVGATLVAGYTLVAPLFDDVYVAPKSKELERDQLVSQLTFYNSYDGLKVLGQIVLDPKSSTIQGLTDLVLNNFIDFEEVTIFEQMRTQNSGALGYNNHSGWFSVSRFEVPPIILISNIFGPSKHRSTSPHGAYTTGGWGTIKMSLNYQNLAHRQSGSYDLARAFAKKSPELKFAVDASISPQTVYGSHWKQCQQDSWEEQVFDNAPDLQVLRWLLKDELIDAWAAKWDISRKQLLEKAEVKVCVGSAWNDSLSFAVSDASAKRPPYLLKSFQQPAKVDKSTVFALGLAGQSPFIHKPQFNVYDMTPAQVGDWSELRLFHYREQTRKKFMVRIVLGPEVLLEFPVGFQEFAAQKTGRSTSVMGSQITVEVSTAVLDEKTPIDIMEYLIPQGQIPSRLNEVKRFRRLEQFGSEVLEIATLELKTLSLEAAGAPPVEYLDSSIIPEGDDADEISQEERAAKNLEAKRYYERLEKENYYVHLGVIRVTDQKLRETLIEQMKKELGALAQLDGQTLPHRIIFTAGDLVVGITCSNKERGIQAAQEVKAMVEARIKTVNARRQP